MNDPPLPLLFFTVLTFTAFWNWEVLLQLSNMPHCRTGSAERPRAWTPCPAPKTARAAGHGRAFLSYFPARQSAAKLVDVCGGQSPTTLSCPDRTAEKKASFPHQEVLCELGANERPTERRCVHRWAVHAFTLPLHRERRCRKLECFGWTMQIRNADSLLFPLCLYSGRAGDGR